jgi:hypothetical protein
MSGLSRRSFVRNLVAGGLLAGAAMAPRRARATGGPLDGGLSTGGPYKVLEIFLNGGADLWPHLFDTSFASNVSWVNPAGLATISSTDWNTLFAPVTEPTWVPTGASDTHTFGTLPGIGSVRWGPAARPLWESGLASRSRMVVVGHEFFPHEAGVPLALTGTSIGRPSGFALGAALNRNRLSGEAPVGFVVPVRNSGIPGHILSAASAVGFHGAGNRPVVIGCGTNSIFTQIARDTPVASTVARADGDVLRSYYNGRYRSMLLRGATRTRSSGYDAYEGSHSTLVDHAGVAARLSEPGLTFLLPATSTAVDNPTSTAVRAATGILAAGARHVTVLDSDWDTHANAAGPTPESYALFILRKTYWLTHALAEAVDSGALDLSDTLVYIHSEFGRNHEGTNGTGHYPAGYPVLLIGGPIVNPGIAGNFTSPGAYPVSDGNYGVAAVRASVALAAGLDPWHADMYSQSHEWLGNAVLGYGTPSAANVPELETNILGM